MHNDQNHDRGAVSKEVCAFLTDIIMTGYAGAEGARLLAEAFESSLLNRYPPGYVNRMKTAGSPASDADMAAGGPEWRKTDAAALKADAEVLVYAAGEGGIYTALWNLGELTGRGLEVNLKDIPILQETIEVCNHLDADPYRLRSGGCRLFAVSDAGRTLGSLRGRGIEAVHIGCLTSGSRRVIINGEAVRFLNRPGPDELYRFIQRGNDNGQFT